MRADVDADGVEFGRDVFTHRRGHQDLLGRRGHPGEGRPTGSVQLGEHVVEQQHRIASLAAQQPECPEP